MLKLEFIKKDKYSNYILIDSNGKKYELNINFIDVEKPNIGTIVYIPKSVLEESVSLNYGKVDKSNQINEKDLIVLKNNNQKVFLQRFYG